MVLAGAHEADHSQLYIALEDGADGACTVLITGDRDVSASDLLSNTKLATARVHGKAIIQISHDAAVNIMRYNSAARKLHARLVQANARLQDASNAGPVPLAVPAATVRFDIFLFYLFFLKRTTTPPPPPTKPLDPTLQLNAGPEAVAAAIHAQPTAAAHASVPHAGLLKSLLSAQRNLSDQVRVFRFLRGNILFVLLFTRAHSLQPPL
jgi:hypothetical protein